MRRWKRLCPKTLWSPTTSGPARRSCTPWPTGALLPHVGGFDLEFFIYIEDIDLGYRLGKHGYRNVSEPAAVVTHTGAYSTNEDSGRMIMAHHESARRSLTKKYSGWALWPIRAVLTVRLKLRVAFVRRKVNRE